MWKEAIGHVVGIWTHDEYEFSGEFWQMPRAGMCTRSRCRSRILRSGARRAARTAIARSGKLGLGLCSFAVGVSPDEVKKKVDIYREALATCTAPIGAFVNDDAATFTMTLCSTRQAEGSGPRPRVVRVVPGQGRAAHRLPHATGWPRRSRIWAATAYAADMKSIDDQGMLDLLTLEYLVDSNACVLGTPEECEETCRLYEEAGIDTLLCLVNPYRIPHEAVMETIELMGKEVIPKFAT